MRMWHETVRDRGGGDTGVNGEDEKAQHSKRRPHAANTALKVFLAYTRTDDGELVKPVSQSHPSRRPRKRAGPLRGGGEARRAHPSG